LNWLVVIHHSPRALDFIEAIQYTEDSSAVIKSLLLAMVSCMPSDLQLSPDNKGNTHLDLQHHLVVLGRVAQEPAIPAIKVIGRLNDLLYKSEICTEGDWVTGNHVLAICRKLLLHHDTQPVFSALGDLLCVLSTEFNDADIRDRARCYYAMLTLLSSDKAKSLLEASGVSSPGPQSLASIVTMDEQFTGHIKLTSLTEPVVTLIKKNHQPSKRNDTSTGRSFQEYNTISLETDVNDKPIKLQEYDKQWRSNHLCQETHLVFDVSLVSNFENIYAVALQFAAPECYGIIEDSLLPHVSKDNADEICIVLKPVQPVPGSINISAMFMDEQGGSYSSPVISICVELDDFFQPLPYPSSKHAALFRNLWNVYSVDHYTDKHTESFYMESVCVLKLCDDNLDALVNRCWSELLISEDPPGTYQLAMFLPPGYHVLMRASMQDAQHVSMAIITDNYYLLPLVTNYLKRTEIAIDN